MSKLHRVLLALGLTLVLATPALAQRVRVRAPGTPSILNSAAECSAYVGAPYVRSSCFACVNRGGRFHLGSNTCHGMAAPPPPPPSVAVARSVYECNTIPFGPKRNRCVSCVSGSGSFFVHANGGFGSCNQAAPPPPPPHYGDGDRLVQRTVGECYSEIASPDKRLRCRTCVQNGGSYFKRAGNGFGQCTVSAPPPPPPSPVMIRTAAECSSYVPGHHQRRACFRCVSSGSTYRSDTGGCFGAPPPPPAPMLIYNVGDCFSRVSHPGMRHQCRQCIHRGGRWDLRGVCR